MKSTIRPDRSITDLEWAWIALNIIDGLLTAIAIVNFGGHEANFLMRPIVTLGWGFVAAKLLLACIVILIYRWTNSRWALWIGNFLVFGVVLWNAFQLMVALAFI